MLTPRQFLWAFITEQSQGEWGDDTIRADIDLFMKMLEKERLVLVSVTRLAELERREQKYRPLLETVLREYKTRMPKQWILAAELALREDEKG